MLSPSEIRHKSEEEKRNIIIDYFKLLSSVPQEHFDKWIADLKTLSDHKVAVDPSKASNFFYDSKKGFSFIDLNSFRKEPLFDKVDHNGQQRHAEFINYSFTPFRGAFYGYPFLEHLKNPDDVNFVKKVAAEAFRKTVTALKKIGITEADVDYTIQHFDIPFLKQLTQNDNIPESI